MQCVIIMTGFCTPGTAELLYQSLEEQDANWEFVRSSELYQQFIKAYWCRNIAAYNCILMAVEQVTMAQVWKVIQDGKSIFVDFSWIPRCNAFFAELEQVKKKSRAKVIWLQSIFSDMEQYKEGMRVYSKTEEYKCLFATNIQEGRVWAFCQRNNHQALYYNSMPFINFEIPGGKQTKEAIDGVCKNLIDAITHENI